MAFFQCLALLAVLAQLCQVHGAGGRMVLSRELRGSSDVDNSTTSSPPPDADGSVYVDPSIGVLAGWLASQQIPSSLTNFLLGYTPSSPAAARLQAALLATLLKQNALATAGNAFIQWSKQFKQKYRSTSESNAALNQFTVALQQLASNNADSKATCMSGLNQYTLMPYDTFADTVLMDSTRFKAQGNRGSGHGRLLSDESLAGQSETLARQLAGPLVSGVRRELVASSVNWTQLGKTPPVVDQGLCGSCWAAAANAAVSAALAINYAGTTPQAFSIQYQLDCCNTVYGTADFTGQGCSYGYGDDAMAMAALYTVPMTGYYNAYTSGVTNNIGTCDTSKQSITNNRKWVRTYGSGVYSQQTPTIWGYDSVTYVTPYSESSLIQAVSVQPVYFMFAVANNFKTYSSGIYADSQGQCGSVQINHAMLLVGYNSVTKIWIAQSSWGTSWGERGFARIKMDGTSNGLCSMYSIAFAPKLNNWRNVPDTVSP